MDQPIFKNLEVDEITGNYFKTAAKWILFICIVYIACIVLFGLLFITSSTAISSAFERVMARQGSTIEMDVMRVALTVFVIFAVIVLTITYFFLMASIQIKRGITRHDQATFNGGLAQLKNGLIAYGILSLLGILLNLVAVFI